MDFVSFSIRNKFANSWKVNKNGRISSFVEFREQRKSGVSSPR